jgi:formylglycine-generating enzyme required for sulfatase activity
MKMKAIQHVFIKGSSFLLGVLFLVSCQPERSKTTGWNYNNPNDKGSGFEKFPAMDQETGPGLTLIEGGVFTMGLAEQDVMKDWNNNPRRVTIPSFYMDQTEVSNFDYLEYLFWLGRVYGSVDPNNPSGGFNQDQMLVSSGPNADHDQDGDPDSQDDDDTDDLPYSVEVAMGTDPDNPDTDGDGVADKDDRCPLNAPAPGTDNGPNGTPDGCEDGKSGASSAPNAFSKYSANYTESFTSNYQEVFRKALPDTLCWRSPLSSMEHFVNYYLRHPAYRDYPVVGVSWIQANEYCKWRTDRVNEYILAREGILDWEMQNKELNPFQMFSTEAYLGGQYFGTQPTPRELDRNYSQNTGGAGGLVPTDDQDGDGVPNSDDACPYVGIGSGTDADGDGCIDDPTADSKSNDDKSYTNPSYSDNGRRLRNYNPSARSVNKDSWSGKYKGYGARIVRMEDGILLPNYRLPTEAEWEYAATGLIGNLQENSENYTDRRTYPWNGHWVRREEEQFQGSIQANFMRTSGDYMGIAGNLNDGAAPTAPVESYWPNDFGLFHMAGNVSEWVQDVYRPNSLDDVDGFSPFRGNVYTTKLTTTIGLHDAMKNDRVRYDVHGMKQYVLDFERVRYQRIAGSNDKPREWDPAKPQGNGRDEKDFEFYYQKDIYTWSKFNSLDKKEDVFKTDGAAGYWIEEANKKSNPSQQSTSPNNTTNTGNNPTNNTNNQSNNANNAGNNQQPAATQTDVEFSFGTNPTLPTVPTGLTLANEFEIDKATGVISSKKGILNPPGKYKIEVIAKNVKTKEDKEYFIEINILDRKILPTDGINMNSKSQNPANARRGTAPDPLFVSSSSLALSGDQTANQDPNQVFNVKKSQYKNELQFIDSVHYWLDTAIYLTNNLRTTEATRQINKGLWGRIFDDAYIIKIFPEYLDDPALTTMISVLRNGLTEYIMETEGQMRYRRVTEEENLGRLNYRKDDYIDYLDGDVESSIFYNDETRMKDINMGKRDPKLVMYQNNHERYNLDGSAIGKGDESFKQGVPTTLVSDRTRVYKGGSWEDNAYWLGCHTRRFLDERQSTRNIGFRCAMDRVGSPTGKNYGKRKKRKS